MASYFGFSIFLFDFLVELILSLKFFMHVCTCEKTYPDSNEHFAVTIALYFSKLTPFQACFMYNSVLLVNSILHFGTLLNYSYFYSDNIW